MNSKIFSQRFNRELAMLGLPEDRNEKTKAVAKVFGVTRHLANAMIFGHAVLPENQLDKIAQILEVCPAWLSGQTERRKAYPSHDVSAERTTRELSAENDITEDA